MKREWLIKLRIKSGKTYKEIAQDLGITTQFYYYIEAAKRRPSPELAQKIGKLFNFDWTKFFNENSSEEMEE